MKGLAFGFLLVLSGCASYSKTIPYEHTSAKLITCGWSSSACYQRAATECPSGWSILGERTPRAGELELTVACE